MEYQVELKQITKSYQASFSKDSVFICKDLSYVFEKGKFYSIMGVSGAGKSTLLHLIRLLDRVDSGEILIGGKETGKMTSDERAFMRKKHIGFVFQDYYLNPKLNVAENIILAMKINKEIARKEYMPKIKGLLEMFGMEELYKRYPKELSGGEQQRVCIARALANDPELILADEPTGNLDSTNEHNVLKHLKMLSQQGKTVIAVTHNDIMKEYSDEVYYLEKYKKD